MTFQPVTSWGFVILFALAGVSLSVWWYYRAAKSTRYAGLKSGAGVLLTALITVALAGPSVPVETESLTSNVEIVLAVDRTGSMAAEDGPGGKPRLNAVKNDIELIARTAPDARFAIVTWDSSARVELPFTTDTSAVVSFADALHQEVSEFSAGSTLERPAEEVLKVLEGAQEARPSNIRYLVVITDGENTEWDADTMDARAWHPLAPLIDGGAVLGYGTPEGGPMKVFLPGGAHTDEYMLDDQDETAISKADPEKLKELAEVLGVPLLMNPTDQSLEAHVQQMLSDGTTISDDRRISVHYVYYTWVPALVAGVIAAALAAGFTVRVARWRQTNAI